MEEKIKTIDGVDYALILDSCEIYHRVRETGRKIINEYSGRQLPPITLAILNGGIPYAGDVIRYLDRKNFVNEFATIGARSYGKNEVAGEISIYSQPQIPLFNRDVIIFEDLIDKGHSLNFVYKYVKNQQPKSIAVYPFCIKPNHIELDFEISGTPFELPDRWAVGYGMDVNGFFRWLQSIYVRVESKNA